MNAARELLDDLALIGATVEPAGDRLILRAGPMAIPARLVNRVREAKADLIATLARHDASEQASGSQRQFKCRTLEACAIEWLNQHPASSQSGRCAWCGRPEISRRPCPAVRDRAGDACMASRRMLASLASTETGGSRPGIEGNGHHHRRGRR